ncbi:MAG: reprolysin-like metallopeptidase [Cyanobacteria bacterium J06597_16]
MGRWFSNYKRKQPSSLSLLVGAAMLLGGCSEGSVQSAQTVLFSESDELFIQPIQVCTDNGGQCAGFNVFEDVTRKILEQAQLKVSFLPRKQLNASRYLTIDYNADSNSSDFEFYQLSRTDDASTDNFGRAANSTRDSGPINVWFVDEIEGGNGATQFGLAWVDANGVLISDEVLDFNGGVGRIDTLAHEIGHNLGLRHRDAFNDGSPNNLLTDGDDRNIPSSLADIGVDGAGLSVLTAAQIKKIQESRFVNRANPGVISNQNELTDDFSADEITQLLDSLATLGEKSAASATGSQAALNALVSEPDRSSVPEPVSILGLSVLGLSLLALKRDRSTAHESLS